MKLLIIDAHAILHRAYHALPKEGFKNKGQLINALYGFFSMLLKVISQLKPDYLLACFDAPGPTFRHQQFIGYQANRPKMADELSQQINLARESLQEAQIPVLLQPGFEADDLIGTIIKKMKKKKKKEKDWQIIVVTGDKDLMQLVDKQVKLFLLTKGVSQAELIGSREVKKRLGVKPEQVVDYKALVGDTSDNYPGVAGIGPKTAVKLLRQFGSLERILREREKIAPKLREKLLAGEKAARLSYQLAQIVCQVPLNFKLSSACWSDEKLRRLKKVLRQLGFPSLVRRIERQLEVKKELKEQMKLI